MYKFFTLPATWLLTTLIAAGAATPAAAESATSTKDFPAIGHGYRVDFGGGNAFKIEFKPGAELTFTKLEEPRLGMVETVSITSKKLREGLYMIYWQEANKTTVVHIEDFLQGEVYTNITRPNGSFYNGKSALTQLY